MQVSCEARAVFVLRALPQLQRKVQHLFVELLQPSVQCAPSTSTPHGPDASEAARLHVRQLAAATYQHFAQSGDAEDARMAVKIATAVSLTVDEAGGAARVVQQLTAVLRDEAQHTKALQPVMATLLAYPEVLSEMRAQGRDVLALLVDVAEHGQRSSAVEVAQLLDADEQVWCKLLRLVPRGRSPRCNLVTFRGAHHEVLQEVEY